MKIIGKLIPKFVSNFAEKHNFGKFSEKHKFSGFAKNHNFGKLIEKFAKFRKVHLKMSYQTLIVTGLDDEKGIYDFKLKPSNSRRYHNWKKFFKIDQDDELITTLSAADVRVVIETLQEINSILD